MKPHPAPDAQPTADVILRELLRIAKYGGLSVARGDLNSALIDGVRAPISVLAGASVAHQYGWITLALDPVLVCAERCVLTDAGRDKLAEYDAELFGGAL